MSNIFADATTATNDGIEEDFLGGGGVLPSDIYNFEIKTAYLRGASSSKAMSVNFIFDINGKEVRQQIWVSNRNGDVTYEDKKTKDKKNLPGFNQVNSLSLLMLGQELGEMAVEERTIRIYDFEAKKEVPQAVDCFIDLHGKKGQMALQQQTVDKTKKDDNGSYVPTGETRDQNEVVKFFAEQKPVTISELVEFVKGLGETYDDIRRQGDPAILVGKMPDDAGVYASSWLAKNKNEVYDKSKGASKNGGKSFAGAATSGGNEEVSEKKTSLFD